MSGMTLPGVFMALTGVGRRCIGSALNANDSLQGISGCAWLQLDSQ